MRKLRITYNAPVTLCFVLLCFVTMVLNIVTKGYSNSLLFMTYHSPLTDPFTYIRFFTHVLGHAGWSHYIGNMSYFLLICPMLEEKHGSKKMITVILITALVTSVLNYILFPNIALCGASGVVFALILMSSFTNIRQGEIPLTFILVAILFLGKEVYEGVFTVDQISNLSHIAGGLVGAYIGFYSPKRK